MIGFEWGVAVGVGASVLSTLASVVAVWIGYKATRMARDGLQLAATGITLQSREHRRISAEPFLDALGQFGLATQGPRVADRVRAGAGSSEPDTETQQAFQQLWTQRTLLTAMLTIDAEESALSQAVDLRIWGAEMTAKVILDRSDHQDPGPLQASPIEYVLALIAQHCEDDDPVAQVAVDDWVASMRAELIEMGKAGGRTWTLWTSAPPDWQIFDVAINLLMPISVHVMNAVAAFVKQPAAPAASGPSHTAQFSDSTPTGP
ncbi:MAG TPA: hypothetical protein PK020_02525 [Ilumatobacteraceae bacterium]|nr:hypothetical protein [Ilumatobacteraceae bacterium]